MKLIGNSNNNKHQAPRHAASHSEERVKRVKAEKPAPAPVEKTGKKKGRKALIALAVIFVIAVGVIVGYNMWEEPPELPSVAATPSPTPSFEPSPSPTPTADVEVTETPELTAEPTPTPPAEPEIEVEALATERSDEIFTFLLVGRDHASDSTDTIIVGKFDTKNHTIDLVNIPRDTLININWGSTPKKINTVYPGYMNSGKSGIDGLRYHIKDMLGFEVDFYAVVNINMVVEVIDAIGGVNFDVPIDMHYDDPSQDFHVHLSKGYQHLSGYEAMGVFRFRSGGVVGGVQTSGYPRGDVQRIETQQALLMAIAGQMLDLGNIPNLKKILDICVSNVETTLTAPNMAYFARQFLKCSREDINFRETPVSTASLINGVSYVSLNIDKWLELVNDYLSPYEQEITRANVNMISANESGSWIDSTTGTIAGSWESFYCHSCTYKNNYVAKWHTPGFCPPDETASSDDPFEGGESTGDTGSADSGNTDSGGTDNGSTGADTPDQTPPAESLPPVIEDPFA